MPLTVSPAARLTQLIAGLALYGTSMAMMTRSGLGLSPWDVLHEGLTVRTGLSFGIITAITSGAVLLAWVPLRQRLGLGTIANVIVIAVTVDLVRLVLPEQHDLGWQITLLVGGVVLNGIATAAYIGVRLGPGPRDGLMTGLVTSTGRSVQVVRTGIEAGVLLAGWLLGGTVGVGTVLYALTIGSLTQFFLARTTWRDREPAVTRGA
ncbi:membrane protein YczE [Haloechinothrix halophila]|uniref:Putative membrane protein n=1 Tax=Haloechinothrix halophila YIM 93223 TaxID=592678 RepID=W9DM89_9PSEU|nr:membrane protein [Haloechinothrix halophila]ETA66564.1 putative membrane protein [Haloechinothrix halophila YIM 93223]